MSVMMAGFAILLMMILHLFKSSVWLDDGVDWHTSFGYIGEATTKILSVSGEICVQIFALTSGYALMMNPRAYDSWQKRFTRLFKFLMAYWVVNLFFLIIGFLNGDVMPDIKELANNMIGLQTGPHLNWVNVPFAWYVCYYIEFILLTPILIWGFSSNKKILDSTMVLSCIILVYVCRKIPSAAAYYLYPLMSTVLGIIIAKYSVFNKLHRLVTGRLHSALVVTAIALVMIARYEIPKLNPLGGNNWQFFVDILLSFIAALLILFSVELFHRIHSRRFKEFFLLLGGLSMYLWFLHGIFFTGKNFLQSFIYSPKEPILILLLCLAVTLPAAWFLKRFQTFIFEKINKKRLFDTILNKINAINKAKQ